MKGQSFYMVFVEGSSTPTFKHDNLESAEIEAKRLCEKLGRKAYVLSTIKSFENRRFHVEDCRPENDDLPF